MSVCPVCGNPAGRDVWGRERKYCSQYCANNAKKKRQNAAKKAGADLGLGKRRCHDCGKPTTDYRCPACLKAWRLKNGVPLDGDAGYGDAFAGGVIGFGA